jgi:lipoprotein LpqH
VRNSVCVAAAAVLMIAGCSSDKAAPAKPGVLPPGTAVLTADGKDVGTTFAVRCESIDWMTRIHTDVAASGVNAMVSNASKLNAEFVRFQDLAGFTGSYERDLQGEAVVTMTGPTYHITGAAMGFDHAQPTRLKAQTFSIAVSC